MIQSKNKLSYNKRQRVHNYIDRSHSLKQVFNFIMISQKMISYLLINWGVIGRGHPGLIRRLIAPRILLSPPPANINSSCFITIITIQILGIYYNFYCISIVLYYISGIFIDIPCRYLVNLVASYVYQVRYLCSCVRARVA